MPDSYIAPLVKAAAMMGFWTMLSFLLSLSLLMLAAWELIDAMWWMLQYTFPQWWGERSKNTDATKWRERA